MVWRRFWESNGLMRTRRWTPRSGRSQPYARAPVHRDRHALEAGLLAFLLVDDLGREPVALGPAQVHPEQHLRPVRRLGAAGAGADRQERRSLVVLAVEQQRGTLAEKVGLEGGRVAIELGLELRIGRFVEQLEGSKQIAGSVEKALPERDLVAQAVGLAEDLLGFALVVPEARFLGQRVELGDTLRLCGEVKAAPRSRGSARPGRGWRMRPPSSGPGDPGAGSAEAR